MKPATYTDGPASARVALCNLVAPELRSKLREVSALVCDEAARGKGHAKALMDRLCAMADDHGTTLMVVVEPFADGPMDTQTLADWYARLGFTQIQQTPPVMARQPKQHGF